MSLQVALVGCGRHGERYLRHLRQGDAPGLEVVALWRRDAAAARALAARYEVDSAPRLEALLDRPGLDAVIVTTPPGSHAEEVLAAAGRGLTVLVEKPLTGTWEQAVALKRELGSGARVMVAQSLRYNAALRRGRELVRDLGRVHRLRLAQRLAPTDLAWQRDARVAGGGSVTLTGVHLFDQLRWWLGAEPDRVQCRIRRVGGAPLENLFDACFEFDEAGVLASCEVSKFSSTRSAWLDAVATEGQLWIDYDHGRTWVIEGRERREVEGATDEPTLPPLLRDFAAFVRGEKDSPVPLSDGLETMRMAEACYRSHREGRSVELREVHEAPVHDDPDGDRRSEQC